MECGAPSRISWGVSPVVCKSILGQTGSSLKKQAPPSSSISNTGVWLHTNTPIPCSWAQQYPRAGHPSSISTSTCIGHQHCHLQPTSWGDSILHAALPTNPSWSPAVHCEASELQTQQSATLPQLQAVTMPPGSTLCLTRPLLCLFLPLPASPPPHTPHLAPKSPVTGAQCTTFQLRDGKK